MQPRLSVLLSYWDCSRKEIRKIHEICKNNEVELDLFIDSGAFSAWSKGAPIKIDDYMQFIRDFLYLKPIYANMDVINNVEKSAENQAIMESWGLNPLPVFHGGSPISEFYRLHERYEYIAVGGLVGSNQTLKRIFFRHIADILNKYGHRKIHMFGVTPKLDLFFYPWHSFDSTAWLTKSLGVSAFSPQRKSKIITAKDYKSKKHEAQLLDDILQITGLHIDQIFRNNKTKYKLANLVQLIAIIKMVENLSIIVENEVTFYIAGMKAGLVDRDFVCRYIKGVANAGNN